MMLSMDMAIDGLVTAGAGAAAGALEGAGDGAGELAALWSWREEAWLEGRRCLDLCPVLGVFDGRLSCLSSVSIVSLCRQEEVN